MWRAAAVPRVGAVAILVGILVTILAACVQTVPLEDRPCECVPGYQCCLTTRFCMRSLQSCPPPPVRDAASTEHADRPLDLPGLPEAAAPDSSPETPPDTGPPPGWTNIAPPPTLAGRSEHTAVWTGEEMIIWGGWAPPT